MKTLPNYSSRAQYRREMSLLLSASSRQDPLAKRIEEGLGKRAVLHDEIVNWENSTFYDTNSDFPLDMRVPPSIIHCDSCGSWIQGCCRIRIKSIKRGKTRRRRASRRLAALKRKESRNGKSYNQSNIRKAGDLLIVDTNEINQLFKVTDGTCKNNVVQTCDCGFQQKMKGTKIPKGMPRKSIKNPAVEDSKNESIIGSDFISLNNTNGRKAKRSFSRSSPPLITGSKKRKKGDKTELMKFLSSLN